MSKHDEKIRWTQDELTAEARRRFGGSGWDWKFECPNCGDIAGPRDFKEIGADPQKAGQECVGREMGAIGPGTRGTDGQEHADRGCDWTAYGLFRGPWLITLPNGNEVGGFRLAPATSEEASA